MPQLKYFYVWQNEFNDLELLLIYQECIYQANKIYEKEKIDYENHFLTKKSFFKGIVPSVSATTINNTTKIPRATCIRKLDKLVKIGFLKKNSFTKKYSTNINFTTHVLPQSKKISKEAIGIFSKFYLIFEIVHCLFTPRAHHSHGPAPPHAVQQREGWQGRRTARRWFE